MTIVWEPDHNDSKLKHRLSGQTAQHSLLWVCRATAANVRRSPVATACMTGSACTAGFWESQKVNEMQLAVAMWILKNKASEPTMEDSIQCM